MRPIEPFSTILGDRTDPPTLSPVGDIRRPDALPFGDARGYSRLFSGLLIKRSPARVMRRGLFQSFVRRSALLKLEHDILRGYDISVVPYPVGLELRAWGIVTDRAGRTFEVRKRGEGLELAYQGGSCRSPREWRYVVGAASPDESDGIRQFYQQAQTVAADRIIVAGTIWVGLWDALWMSFDIDRGLDFLEADPEFASEVFTYWHRVQMQAVSAMLDAGVRLILVREHAGGFRAGAGMAERLDPFIGERFRELAKVVRSRGGCMVLDGDVDELFETDYPYHWGFDGVGPLTFRDEEDILTARACLAEELLLVGTMTSPRSFGRFADRGRRTRGIIVTNQPATMAETMIMEEETAEAPEEPIDRGFRVAGPFR